MLDHRDHNILVDLLIPFGYVAGCGHGGRVGYGAMEMLVVVLR